LTISQLQAPALPFRRYGSIQISDLDIFKILPLGFLTNPKNKIKVKAIERNLSRHENGTFYFVARVRGKLVRQSLKTEILPEARRRLRDLMFGSVGQPAPSENTNSIPDGPPVAQTAPHPTVPAPWVPSMDRPRLGDALKLHDDSLAFTSDGSREMAERGQRVIRAFCADWNQFEPARIWSGYRVSRVENLGRELGSACNHLRWYFGKFVPWAVRRGWLSKEVLESLKEIRKIKVNPRRIRVPSVEQVDELLKMIATEDADGAKFLRFLAVTGMRRGGAIRLAWEKIDFQVGQAWVWQKGGREKLIPLTPEALALLRELPRKGNGPFTALDINALERLERQLKRFAKGLGVDLLTFHSFRHYYASIALMAGLSAKEVAELLGHADGGILVLSTYGHICAVRLRSAVAGLRLASCG